jgi:hypothetical protein
MLMNDFNFPPFFFLSILFFIADNWNNYSQHQQSIFMKHESDKNLVRLCIKYFPTSHLYVMLIRKKGSLIEKKV